jgi:hypothetical protein
VAHFLREYLDRGLSGIVVIDEGEDEKNSGSYDHERAANPSDSPESAPPASISKPVPSGSSPAAQGRKMEFLE